MLTQQVLQYLLIGLHIYEKEPVNEGTIFNIPRLLKVGSRTWHVKSYCIVCHQLFQISIACDIFVFQLNLPHN
jgi:hypothetical protein